MNVVDSSVWIEYLSGGPNAAFFSEPIEGVDSLLVPTLSLFEVYRHLLRHVGKDHALTIVATRLPLADSILLATARAHGPHVRSVCRTLPSLRLYSVAPYLFWSIA